MDDLRTEEQKTADRLRVIGIFGDFNVKFTAEGVSGRHGQSRLSGTGSMTANGKKRATGDVETTGSGQMGG